MSETTLVLLRNAVGTGIRDAMKIAAGYLAARGVTIGESHQEMIISLAVAAAMWLIAFAWSQAARWLDRQKQPVKTEPADVPASAGFRGSTFGLLLAVPVIILAVGCQSRLETAHATRATVNAALAESLNLHAAGVIDDSELRLIRDAGRAAEPVLDELDRAAISNNRFNWIIVLNEARLQVDRVLRAAIEARLRKPKAISTKERSWTPRLHSCSFPLSPLQQRSLA